MKSSTIWWLAIISLVILVSCGGGGGGSNGDPINPPPDDKTAEWTVMCYFGGHNNLAPWAINSVARLEQVGSTEKVKFTALLDAYYRDWSKFGAPVTAIFNQSGSPISPMMLISKHPEEGVQSHLSDSQAIKYDTATFNSARPANLTSFIKWSTDRFPAKKYALVIMNHGSSWLPGRKLNGAVSDDGTGEAMYIHDIASAIIASDIHLDLLDFDACNMASVEVAYQLRSVTDYITASQRTESAPGDDYSSVAAYLTSHPNVGADALGRNFVDSFISYFEHDPHGSSTKSLILTDKVDEIAGALSEVTPLLTNSNIINSSALLDTIEEPVRFFQDVDLGNYANVLTFHVNNAALDSALNNLKQASQDAVVYNKIFYDQSEPPDWSFGSREFGSGQDINVNGVSGINIYMPWLWAWKENDFGYYSSIGFAQASGWNWVIAHAYEGIPFLGTAPGDWVATLVWSTNVDLDLWVFEPDGVGGVVPASPWIGPESINGYLSIDSAWTGISTEIYQAKPEIIWGPYFFIATYAQPSILPPANSAYCALGIFDSPVAIDPSIVTNDYYISSSLPNDPDFGPGVVYFGFAIYDPDEDIWWFAEGDRGGEAVTEGSIESIGSQLHALVPETKNEEIRKPQSLDEGMINEYHNQGFEMAIALRDSLIEGELGNTVASDTWAKIE